ncbi:alginate export family protein [Hypericibacter adhaerens]|uniref:Alginate export family protein n=2 Tax=Hypericibacter adhaerens TaxID=2602016 RepID=A0A5J6MWB5_9PROT|nr:alginate export family protein [Hypericibacter adhaerens]
MSARQGILVTALWLGVTLMPAAASEVSAVDAVTAPPAPPPEDLGTPSSAVPHERPAIKSNRWQENWSALSDPALRTEPLDGFKYIPISPTDPHSYLSFGLTLRERFESNHAPAFGVGESSGDSYLLQRLQFHLDAHFDENWRAFVQFEDARAFDKDTITPADQNALDLRLAFLEYTRPFDADLLKARIGRQDFAFDLQRFVSSRDGPNLRQSFDAIWADWETPQWRFIGFVSQPVQYRDGEPFDDTSNEHFRFHTLRVERHVLGTNELSSYYSYYERDDARFLDASGDEHRHILDVRFAGADGGFDWDLEAMGQVGSVGSDDILAWGMGARAGYTFSDVIWQPRLGFQVDAASGDHTPGDGTLGTFNPLFPNGYYFSLAGFTGYSNLIHLKPSITVKPIDNLTVTGAVGLQWRETTSDAVYVQPANAVNGTAGEGGAWTGYYSQLRADYAFNANLTGAVELVHYVVGDAVRNAGGHDSDYVGVELKFSW